MKITLIIAQTLDGFIAAGPNDKLAWGSHNNKLLYKEKTIEIGTVIMGSTTYQNMPAVAFKDRKTLVLTSNPAKYQAEPKAENITFFKGTAAEAVAHLDSAGITQAALVGGSNVNGQFLAAGLINEMFITIAPILFGSGIKSFFVPNQDLEPEQLLTMTTKLELQSVEEIGDSELLLHYSVLK